jgi:hypothetical protein
LAGFVVSAATGDGIALLTDAEDARRWRFTGITADSFTWRVETSYRGGATGHFDQANARHPS